MTKPKVHPYIVLAGGLIFASSAPVIFKLGDAPADAATGYRLLFSVLLMTPLILWKHMGELKKLSPKEWFFCFASGFFLASHFTLMFESLRLTSVANTALLISMQSLFTFTGAYLLLKERLSLLSLGGAFIAIIGSVIIFWNDIHIGEMVVLGNILALLSALMMSCYLLFGQYLRRTLSLMTYTYVVYGAGATCVFIYLIITRGSVVGYSSQNWVTFFALALIPTIMGHSVFNWVVKLVGASSVSLATVFMPICAASLAYFFIGEVMSISQTIGGSVILIGIYIFIKNRNHIK